MNKKLLAGNNVVLHAFMSLWILIQLTRHNSSTLLQGAHRFLGSCCNAGVFKTQGFAALTSARTAACSMKLVKTKAVLVKMTDFICMGFGFPPKKMLEDLVQTTQGHLSVSAVVLTLKGSKAKHRQENQLMRNQRLCNIGVHDADRCSILNPKNPALLDTSGINNR